MIYSSRSMGTSHTSPQSSFPQSLLEGLKLMRECPLCSHAYDASYVDVLDEYNGTHYIHITCAQCHHALLALVAVSSHGMSSVGMLTDLTAADAVRFAAQDALLSDDVLEFHSLLFSRTTQPHMSASFEQLFT